MSKCINAVDDEIYINFYIKMEKQDFQEILASVMNIKSAILSVCQEKKIINVTMHKKCPYSELFWSVFSLNARNTDQIRSISAYPVRKQENTDPKISDNSPIT